MAHSKHLLILLPSLALQISAASAHPPDQPLAGKRTISESTYVLNNKGAQSCATTLTFDELGNWALSTTYSNSKRKFGERVRAVLTLTAKEGTKSVALGQEAGLTPVPYCGENCQEVVTHSGQLAELVALRSASVRYVCMNTEHRMSFFFPSTANIVLSCQQFESQCARVEDPGHPTNLDNDGK